MGRSYRRKPLWCSDTISIDDATDELLPLLRMSLNTLFLNSNLVPVPRELNTLFEPWMALVVLIGLLVFAVVRNQYPGYLQNVRWSFSNYRITRQAFAEGDFSFKSAWLVMFPAMVAAYAWFVYLIAARSNEFCFPTGLNAYLQLVLAVFVVYVLKLLVILLVELLTKPGPSLKVYWGNTILLNQTVALPLMFVSLSAALASGWLEVSLIYTGAALLLLTYLLRLIRGVSAALQSRISLNYIILYLCTLEILPLAVIIKAWYMVYTNC